MIGQTLQEFLNRALFYQHPDKLAFHQDPVRTDFNHDPAETVCYQDHNNRTLTQHNIIYNPETNTLLTSHELYYCCHISIAAFQATFA